MSALLLLHFQSWLSTWLQLPKTTARRDEKPLSVGNWCALTLEVWQYLYRWKHVVPQRLAILIPIAQAVPILLVCIFYGKYNTSLYAKLYCGLHVGMYMDDDKLRGNAVSWDLSLRSSVVLNSLHTSAGPNNIMLHDAIRSDCVQLQGDTVISQASITVYLL